MSDDYYSAAGDSFGDFGADEQQSTGLAQSLPMRLLRGRWHWAIVLGLLLATGGAYVGFNLKEPEFEAASDITINPDYGVAVDIADLELDDPYWQMVGKEVDTLTAVETAEKAMQQNAWQEAIAQVDPKFSEMTPEDFVASLDLDAPKKNDLTMEVYFISENPLIAQAGLNSLLKAYRDMQKKGQTTKINRNLKLLQNQKRDLELRQRQIKEQIRLLIPDDEFLMIKRRLASKLGELANMEFKLSEIELMLSPFIDPDKNSQVSLQKLMMQDPEMLELLERKKAYEDDYYHQTVVQGRGETMASVVAVKREIRRVDRQILELETSWLSFGEGSTDALPRQIQELMATRNVIIKKIGELQAEAQDIAARLSAVEEDELELEQTRVSIRVVQGEIDELEVTGELITDNTDQVTRIEIGEEADLPTSPANKMKRIQLAGMGGMGGMGMGFGFVMLIGLMDRRLRHVSDTETTLPGINMLGILPTLPANLKDPEQAETASHCVHHIRTLLQIGGSNRVFSITSPTAGSGKSSLATALGMSFAATGSRTLVIDSDLVGAGISRRMGSVVHESLDMVIRRKGMLDEAVLARAQTIAASQQQSLEEVLLEENLLTSEQLQTAQRLQLDTSLGLLDACAPGRLRSCIASTEVDNFYVLPVGKARPSDATRLSPAAMRELIRQAREAFDIVLIDTGPVLGSLEASIAAAESDSTVMIVSRGDHRSIATKSINQLRSVHAEIAGVVFNHALDSDFAQGSYASMISQERRPDLSIRRRKLDKTRSARLGPLGTAVASCIDDDNDSDEALMVSSNGKSGRHG